LYGYQHQPTRFTEEKMSKKMIAYCGLGCTECPAYLATQANDPVAAQKIAAEWSKAYSADVKVENVWCDGCLVDGKKCAHCGECEIRACAQNLGVENCARCGKYPCAPLEGFFKMAPMARQSLEALRKP
jgi:hypothetical protein